MIKYLAFAFVEKLLSVTPGGEPLYRAVGEVVNRDGRGLEVDLMEAGADAVAWALTCVRHGERVVDLGTGWHYKDALLYALTGRFEVHAFDVRHIARLSYVQNYITLVNQQLPMLSKYWQVPEAPMRAWLGIWRECQSFAELREAAVITMRIAPGECISYEKDSLAFVSSY